MLFYTSRGGLSRTRNADFCSSPGGLPELSEEFIDISALLAAVWEERGMPADLSKFRQQSIILPDVVSYSETF